MADAKTILAIALTDYGFLFREPGDLDHDARALLRVWHPDLNTDPLAGEVTRHINALRAEAEKDRKAGTWRRYRVIRVSAAGRTFDYTYQREIATDAAKIYIAAASILTIPSAGDVAEAAMRTIRDLPEAPGKLAVKMSGLVPKIGRVVDVGADPAYVTPKGRDWIRLRDALAARGAMDPRHVAWIMSGCYELANYLHWAGTVHLGFDVDHVFIHPAQHRVALLAGWEFAGRGTKPLLMPGNARRVIGDAEIRAAPTSPRHHLTLIKALGRDLLGDATGAALFSRKDVPRALALWLTVPGGTTALKEYEAWETCLAKSFGARRFVELVLPASDIYGD